MVVVKKFSATWCGPCKMLAPVFESQIKPNYSNVKFEDIDVDLNPDLAENYNVTSVPTVIVERNGVLLQRFAGVQSPMTYKNAINEAIK